MRPFFATKMLFLMRLKCYISHFLKKIQEIGIFIFLSNFVLFLEIVLHKHDLICVINNMFLLNKIMLFKT